VNLYIVRPKEERLVNEEEKRETGYSTAATVLVGLALVGFMAMWIIYNQYILRSSRLNLNHNLPVAVICIFLLLAAFRSRLPEILTRNRLVLLTSMLLGSSFIPGDGLMSFVLGSWTMPIYFATPENQWETFHPYLKNWVVPTQEQGIRWFHEGRPDLRALPWDIWIRPFLGWAMIGLAFIGTSLGLSSIFRKQWMENEKLTYPMMIPLQILAGDRKELMAASPGRFPLFWAGFAISFGIMAWNALTFFNDYLPDIDLRGGWVHLVSGGINVYTSQINLLTLGLAYFASVEILVSACVFFLIKHIEIIIATRIGYTMPLGSGATHPGSASPLISWQTAGAFLTYVGWSIWNARARLREVYDEAIRNSPRQGGDLISSRTALALITLGVTFILLWLRAAGFETHVAVALTFSILVSYVGISKMSAELGLPYLQSPFSAEAFAVASIGTSSMNQASILMLSFTKNMEGYNSGMSMSLITVIQKLRGQLSPVRLLVGLLLALGFAYLVSMLYAIWLGYDVGGYNLSSYTYKYYARTSYQRAVFRMTNPWPVDTDRLTILVIGGGVMAILMGMRFKLPWFRLHPIGFAIPLIPHQFSTFLMAWAIKATLLRVGGMASFQRGIPFFVGLVAGHAAGVALSSLVDFLFFPGSGHTVHWW
jgi:hypothetical protein